MFYTRKRALTVFVQVLTQWFPGNCISRQTINNIAEQEAKNLNGIYHSLFSFQSKIYLILYIPNPNQDNKNKVYSARQIIQNDERMIWGY